MGSSPHPQEADSLETRAAHRKHVAQPGICPGPNSAQLGGLGLPVMPKWQDEGWHVEDDS